MFSRLSEIWVGNSVADPDPVPFVGIREGESSEPGSGIEKNRIQDKHPESATLIGYPEKNLHLDPGFGSRGKKWNEYRIRIRNTGCNSHI